MVNPLKGVCLFSSCIILVTQAETVLGKHFECVRTENSSRVQLMLCNSEFLSIQTLFVAFDLVIKYVGKFMSLENS